MFNYDLSGLLPCSNCGVWHITKRGLIAKRCPFEQLKNKGKTKKGKTRKGKTMATSNRTNIRTSNRTGKRTKSVKEAPFDSTAKVVLRDDVRGINTTARKVYEIAKDHGFHDNDDQEQPLGGLAIVLGDLHMMISELWEAGRKGKLDGVLQGEVDYKKVAWFVAKYLYTKMLQSKESDIDSLVFGMEGRPIPISRLAIFAMNLHGETSEFLAAAKVGLLDQPCDKPVDLSCGAEELADLSIRTMDTAFALGVDLGEAIRVKSAYNQTREHMHGKKA